MAYKTWQELLAEQCPPEDYQALLDSLDGDTTELQKEGLL